MAEPGLQVQGIPAPWPPPAQAQDGKQDPHQHVLPAQQGQQVIHLNWSYFKPEFSGKPDECAGVPPAQLAAHLWSEHKKVNNSKTIWVVTLKNKQDIERM